MTNAGSRQRRRFIGELEFEKGTEEEIAIETALLDFRIDPAFLLRADILLPPLGAFDQNHDSPRWEFVVGRLSRRASFRQRWPKLASAPLGDFRCAGCQV